MEELRTYLGALFKENEGEVITTDHPRFREFRRRLARYMVSPSNCRYHDYRHARAVLEGMDGIDVAATLAYYRQRGGYCDCEILFNVMPEETGMEPLDG